MVQRAKWLAFCLWLVALAPTAISASDADARRLAAQRAAFIAVYPEAERGNFDPAERERALLEDYVLWPDLRAAWFKATMDNVDHGDIEGFLDYYGTLKPARELRYRYVLHLAKEGHLDDFHRIYQQFYQGLDVAKLDCLALQAELDQGRGQRIVSRGLELWLTGRSQDDECDPVFKHLRANGQLTDAHYAERFALAIEAQQFRLARYLSRPLEPNWRAEASNWIVANDEPANFVRNWPARADRDIDRLQLIHALKKIAYRDPLQANETWSSLRDHFAFTSDQEADVARYIALWAARTHLAEASELLANLDSQAQNEETARWHIRALLLAGDWDAVVTRIDALPSAMRLEEEWRYWKASALAKLGDPTAVVIFDNLSSERSYYGFLAADAADNPYQFAPVELQALPGIVDSLLDRPDLFRAHELFLVGLDSRGRSEWDAAIAQMTPDEQRQAALLAHASGWHSRAIATVAKAGTFDDLRLRYPLPWQTDFREHAGAAGIAESWAYGVARSESLFMRDVRSSAGAIGVMQLMPATGRDTAREINLPYRGLATLTDSASNIRLGTWYLGKMYTRFGDNRVLATAAYNAGPHRIDRWLPEDGAIDARIWIENIPFNETRAYVRRVLTDETIFYWRLHDDVRRLSALLPQISASSSSAKASD